MAKTYDPKCFDLAETFLADQPGATDEDRAELAAEIQDCIEDFTIRADRDEAGAWATTGGGAA